jgi:hypothetical protein
VVVWTRLAAHPTPGGKHSEMSGLIPHPIFKCVRRSDRRLKIRSHSHLATGIRDIGPPSLVAVGGREWLCARRRAENEKKMKSVQAGDDLKRRE